MKRIVSTRVEEEVGKRIARLAARDESNEALIVRKCIVRYLPTLEREILGDQFVQEVVEEVAS